MERIIRRMFLVGCLLTGIAVSFTAVGSYAVETTGSAAASTGAELSTTFSLKVGPAFALTNVSFAGTTIDSEVKDYIQAVPGSIAKGTLSATVQSNTGYALQLSATNPALTSGANTIPAKTFADTNATVTESGWGVKKSNGEFTALTDSLVSFFSTTTSAPNGTQTNLEVGVGVAKTQPAGDYSTTVTLTVVKHP